MRRVEEKEKKDHEVSHSWQSFGVQLSSVCPLPTLRISLLGNAQTSNCGFCYLTPVPHQHLRILWHRHTKTEREREIPSTNLATHLRGEGLINKQ